MEGVHSVSLVFWKQFILFATRWIFVLANYIYIFFQIWCQNQVLVRKILKFVIFLNLYDYLRKQIKYILLSRRYYYSTGMSHIFIRLFVEQLVEDDHFFSRLVDTVLVNIIVDLYILYYIHLIHVNSTKVHMYFLSFVGQLACHKVKIKY